MLVVSCFFIFLLCLSKPDYSNARHLKGEYSSEKYLSRPDTEKVDEIQIDKAKLEGIIKRGHGINIDDRGHNSATAHEDYTKKLKLMRSTSDSIEEYIRGKFSSFVLKKHNLVSVSWRIPSKSLNIKNPNERNPEFYSDYSQPRTRPPSHN